MRELWTAVPCVSKSMASLWPACVVLLKMMLVLCSCSHVSGAQRETTKLRQYVGGPAPASVGAANGSPNGVGSSSGGGSNTNGVTGAASNSFTGIGSSSSRSSGGSSIGSSSTNNNLDLIDEQSRMSSAASAAAAASSPNGPFFDKMASKNITALLGKTTYLNCRIKNLGNKTTAMQVSWVRHRDIHLLTVGRYTYTSDQRFRAIHHQHSEDWMLQIKYPQHRDSGVYECQVSTTPHMSHFIHLNVIEPSTEIIGAPDLYIESGSTINLTCVILNSPEPPAYIFWNHNSAIITYESPRGGVSVLTKREETSTSFLLITNARTSDSGQYTCNPSNSKPKTVTVHVLNGEFPAAMQRAGQPHHRIPSRHGALVTVCAICSTWLLLWLSSLTGTARGIRKNIGSGRRGCRSSSILALQSALPGSVC